MKNVIFLILISALFFQGCKEDDEVGGNCECAVQGSSSYDFDSTFVPTNDTVPLVVYIPNAFTPNGNGQNDLLYVYGSGIALFHLVVKDGGNIVFETFDLGQGWNGAVNGSVPDCSNFNYMVDITFYTGNTGHFEGEITLFKDNGICPVELHNCRFGNQFDGTGFNPQISVEPFNC